MKKFLSVLLAAVLALSLAACGGGDSSAAGGSSAAAGGSSAAAGGEDKVRIGLSIAGLTMPYYVRMYDGFMEAAEKKGYEVIFADGGSDAESTVRAVEDLISNDIDALAVSTNYSEALVDSFAKCEELGIPIFYIGNLQLIPEAQEYMTFWEGTKADSAGYLGGEWVAQYLDSINYKKDLNVICVSKMLDTLLQRYEGFERALEDNGYTVNLINTVGDLPRETALSACEDALMANDDVDIFFGTAGTSSLGAYDATQNMGRDEVMVVGFDGEDEEIQHIDEDTNYIATICQQPALESAVTVDAIETVLGGGTVEGGHETPAIIYGKGVGYVED